MAGSRLPSRLRLGPFRTRIAFALAKVGGLPGVGYSMLQRSRNLARPAVVAPVFAPVMRHCQRHEPGPATIEPAGREGAAIEGGQRLRRAQDAKRGLVAEICAGRQSGEAIAHGIADTVHAADMRILVE